MLSRVRPSPPTGFIEPCLPWLYAGCLPGLRINEHLPYAGDVVFPHACQMGLEGIVSKRLGSRYRSGRTSDWLKFKNPDAPAVKREAEEDCGARR